MNAMSIADRGRFGVTKLGLSLVALMIVLSGSNSKRAQSPPTAQQAPATPSFNQDPSKPGKVSSLELDTVLADLAKEIQQRKFKAVVVIGAKGPGDQISELGPELGDDISAGFSQLANGFRVVDRGQLRALLKRERVSDSMLSSDAIEDWIAGKANADGFVEVKIWSVKESQIVLTLSLYKHNGEDGKMLLMRRAGIEMDSDQLDAIRKLLNSDAEIAARKGAIKPAELGLSSMPVCIECDRPEYSDVARRAKHQGKATIVITVTPEGAVNDIAVVKAAGLTLDAVGIQTVKYWKFKPARDLNGMPVAARIEAELQWELF
jgi:TonB family protein